MQVEAKEGAKPLAAKPLIAGVVEVHSMIMESGVVPLTLVIEDRAGQVSAKRRQIKGAASRGTIASLAG